MTTSEQLERETEQTREQIAATLDELRGRMTPGRVVDQLVDYANDSSGGLFFRNLQQQVVNNPLPVALVGAGLAWLALANRNGRARTHGWAEQTRSAAADVSTRAQQAGAGAADAAFSGYEQTKDAAAASYGAAAEGASAAYNSTAERARAAGARMKSAAGSVTDTASATYDAAAEQMRRTGDRISQSAAHMQENVSGASRNFMNFLNEQPLVLAGLGIAIGAVLGAALPSTETEDELVGEESDALKKQASDFAGEQIDKGRSVIEEAWQSAREEGRKQGLMPGTEDASSVHDDLHAAPGTSEQRYSQGTTGGGEEATLVPSAGTDVKEHKREHSGT